MTPLLATTVVTLVLGAALVGCGSDQPAVCGSVDTLETSIDDLRNVDVKANGLSALQSQLTTIKGDLADVKDDATSEFSTQITAVETSYSALKDSADAAKADTSQRAWRPLASAVSALAADVKTLVNGVQSTC
jgi:hypothetical protein